MSTHRAGLSYTTVRVATAGDVTEFSTLQRLMSGSAAAAAASSQATSAPASASLADELRKLAELRDAGVLTAAETEAQKDPLLG